MSLRARLAVLYTSIVGGILLLLGVAVYGAVSVTLTTQVDEQLRRTYQVFATNLYLDTNGELGLREGLRMDLAPGILFQLWSRDRRLLFTNLPQLAQPLDTTGINASKPVWLDSNLRTQSGDIHLRVYSIPLVVGDVDRPVGVLQIATSMSVVDATLSALVRVLLVGVIVSMSVAGLAGWMSTRQALAPLGDVTRVALQITRADDLSRRIPYSGPDDDEVGQLIKAFNQTLSRLEGLFNTQRRFLADVGHELRTPLTVIKGNVYLMRRMNCLDAESMEGIENEVDRLTRMVGDLLLLAQAESGKLPLNMTLLELDTIVLEVMHQMKVISRDRQQLKLGEIDQVLVCGDQDRIKQVLVNLIGNAIKYTPVGGMIVVGLGKDEKRARLTVTDDGPGIPLEDQPHIFERFYRGEKSRTREKDGKGFGLGLSIAYWIVRNHHGMIEVQSSPGKGTTFCVWLPLAEGDCTKQEAEM